MSYEKKISQANPGFIELVLDDSGSMADDLPGTNDPKYRWVEKYSGIILHELLERCTELKGNDAVIKKRYFLSVIKYGGRSESWGDPVLDIETAVEKFANEGDSFRLGGLLAGTDAQCAMKLACDILSRNITDERFRDSYPPLVLHITDGMSFTDASKAVAAMKQLSTADGGVLVANAYIGTQTSLNYTGPDDFPGYADVSEAGPSSDNIKLFEMSSVMPPSMEKNLKETGIFPRIRPNSRLFFDVRTREMLKHVIQVIGSIDSRMAR